MKTIEDHFRDWESYVFGFGYGSGEGYVIKSLKDILNKIPLEGTYDYQILEGDRPELAWLFINIFGHNDIIEYGTSTRYAWLTDQGKNLKQFVDSHNVEQLVSFADYDPSNIEEGKDICYPEHCNCGLHGYSKIKLCHNPFWKERGT